jgi:DNA-binding transcriptional ArsR family regulator
LPSPDRTFAALGDPTRREILHAVATRGDATATELAAALPVTRQAVAKHLGILAGAGLVESRRAGRETRYAPTPEPLGDAIAWMTELGAQWDARLARLKRSVS